MNAEIEIGWLILTLIIIALVLILIALYANETFISNNSLVNHLSSTLKNLF